MIDCPCGYGKDIKETQSYCNRCGTDLTPLHRLNSVPQKYYEEGIKLLDRNLSDQAIEKFMTAISLGMNNASPYIMIGDIYKKKCLYDDAVHHYQKAQSLDPDNDEIKGIIRQTMISKAETNMKEFKQTQNIRLFRRLLFVIPFLAFIAGLSVSPIFQKQQIITPPPPTVQATVDDPAKIHKPIEADEPVETDKPVVAEVPIAVNVPAEAKVFPYRVRSGDNLMSIAYRFYGESHRYYEILEANKEKIADPDKITIGQVISIPIDVRGRT